MLNTSWFEKPRDFTIVISVFILFYRGKLHESLIWSIFYNIIIMRKNPKTLAKNKFAAEKSGKIDFILFITVYMRF